MEVVAVEEEDGKDPIISAKTTYKTTFVDVKVYEDGHLAQTVICTDAVGFRVVDGHTTRSSLLNSG